MRIIIAPAKKMAADTDSFAVDGLPRFLEQAERLKAVLQAMSPKELQGLWKCNDAIARLNVERLERMDLRRNLTPAVLAYEGIQCKMARGQMVRWLAEHNVTDRADIRAFDQLGYRFHEELSTENHDVFLKQPELSTEVPEAEPSGGKKVLP